MKKIENLLWSLPDFNIAELQIWTFLLLAAAAFESECDEDV